MNGLELSEKYYHEACLPILRQEAPAALELLASGLVGEGSECFGWDDEISRDHSWGPRVCLFLRESDMPRFSAQVNRALELFPSEFMGFRVCPASPLEGKRAGLFSVDEFYTRLIGFPRAPSESIEWLSIPEVKLAPAVNGRIFRDPVGELTARRNELLGFYPEDVRRWLLARHAAVAAQTGQVNLVRCFLHGERLAENAVKHKFAESAASIIFLLEKRYRPFYKWLYRALRELSPLGERAYRILLRLSEASDIRDEQSAVEELCALIVSELRQRQLSASTSDFLMEHCSELLSGITDQRLRLRPLPLAF